MASSWREHLVASVSQNLNSVSRSNTHTHTCTHMHAHAHTPHELEGAHVQQCILGLDDADANELLHTRLQNGVARLG
jgi:hypothetical protein